MTADLRDWLLASITQRYRSNADLALSDYIFSNSLFHSIAREQVEFIFAHRVEMAAYLGNTSAVLELVEHCIDSTKRYTYERNQFVNFTAEYDELLNAQYHDFISQTRAALQKSDTESALESAMVAVLTVHHQRLRLIMASYCVAYQDADLHTNPLLRTVPCEEYSAKFQLSLLGLDLHDLIEPVLDIGCGMNGTLVRYLRANGLSAYGVDRLAPQERFFLRDDWFSFDHVSQPWGSVLAHQSLSTHFIYAYLHQPVSIEKFAKLTMKIINGLQSGSFLAYAPGMPFFESQIEKMPQFSVTRQRISMHLPEVEQIAYSTKIQKVK
ncbi:MAG: hypothetical protein QM730_28465 [Anaerolineales bacterium]